MSSEPRPLNERERDLVLAARRLAQRPAGSAGATSGVVLDAPPAPDAARIGAPDPAGEPAAPPHIPGYDLVGELSRGGQAVVYRGVQQSTHKPVAIKVMKSGPFGGPSDRARFEREVRILAQLDHAHIVAVRDSGQAGGFSYFVMDLIGGQALDAWVSGDAPPQRRVLECFAKVCEAVNAAHVSGVIHRDLKPGNVRVDEKGEPHVLDFGLARLCDDDSSAATLTGEFVGTAPWASPEQAEGTSHRVDTRSDVYSLGVMLYQVLTGRFPYPVRGTIQQVLRHVVSTPPTRPRTLRRDIDDELETIVLKCLAKDPPRRYQSAGELARDLRRYLHGDPIEAKSDSLAYLISKQLRRYWLPTALVAGLAATVVAGLGASLWFWHQAATQRDRALEAESQQRRLAEVAEDARQQEQQQREAAQASAKSVSRVNKFLDDMLGAIDPRRGRASDVTVRELLDEAARRLDKTEITADPRVLANLRFIVGRTYYRLGLLTEAEPHLRDALALRREALPDQPEAIVQAANMLAGLLADRGRLDEAAELATETAALARERWGAESAAYATALHDLGSFRMRQQRWDESRALLDESRRIREGLPQTTPAELASGLNMLAVWFIGQGRYAEAEPVQRQAVERRAAAAARPDDPVLLLYQSNLAFLLVQTGQLEWAAALLEPTLSMQRQRLPSTHPDLARTLVIAARLKLKLGEPAAAEGLVREALEIRRRALPADHWEIDVAEGFLGECLAAQGRIEEARPLMSVAAARLAARDDVAPNLKAEAAARLSVLPEGAAGTTARRASSHEPPPDPEPRP